MPPRTRKTANPKPERKPPTRGAATSTKKRKGPAVPQGEFQCSVTWDDRPPSTTFTLPYLLSDEQADHVVLFLEEVVAARGRK
jgi:hypothetical protein